MPEPGDLTDEVTVAAAHGSDARGRMDRLLFARRDSGDRRARDELIERFLPLARSVARRYQRPGEPLEDLIQVASLGLVKAIDRFEPDRGYAFTSFAVPTIAGELKRYFRDRTWVVRPPRELQELSLRVDRAWTTLSQQLDRAPTVAELAAAVRSTDEHVLEALQARSARSGLSLQASAGAEDERLSLQDEIGVTDGGYARAEDRVLLDGLLDCLPPRSQTVLRLRFERELTQAEIGAMLGLSQMQISRIVRGAIDQLRHIADQQQMLQDRGSSRHALA
ncbi:MAG TPA: SigB/SigF/SigG family RNA polymerase sigma factor [Solirubrobacteraceae bacterium]|jgi:RNA polymerase sigma-B factor|nr:SigB/SigF/SigG family RNA polymerase sigma factor [Solirubrobacteraceae bacterium]